MRAEIRSFDSPDIVLDGYRPENEVDDGFLLTMYVGPVGGPGEESFQVEVCTPQWFARRLQEAGGLLDGRHTLFVQPMDVERVLQSLRQQVESFDEETWSALATRIGRLGYWEFEDYRS